MDDIQSLWKEVQTLSMVFMILGVGLVPSIASEQTFLLTTQ